MHEKAITEVVLCGQVTEQCFHSAIDAHVRHYDITVLTDAVIEIDHTLGSAELRMMGQNIGARIVSSRRWGLPAATV
jgi:nicotinamidase-related amidase